LYFNMNVEGVAYGTLVASTVTTIIFVFYTFHYLRKITSLEINVRDVFNIKKIQSIFNINFNIFIRTILLTFSFLYFTYLGNSISEDVVAANTILLNLTMLSAFILDAYAFSTEGVVGYSIGAKDKKLLKSVIKNSFILSAASSLIICVIFLIGKNSFIEMMTDIPDIREISFAYSNWVVIIPFISSFCFQFDGIFVGASQTKELRNAMIISVVIYVLSSFYLLANFGNTGLWISLSIFFVARAITLLMYVNRIFLRLS